MSDQPLKNTAVAAAHTTIFLLCCLILHQAAVEKEKAQNLCLLAFVVFGAEVVLEHQVNTKELCI